MERQVSTTQAIFNYYYPMSEPEVAQTGGVFTWGESRWLDQSLQNKGFGFPSLWDPKKDSLAKNIFRSGIGYRDNLSLRKIGRGSDLRQWEVSVENGFYFLNDEREFLWSDSAHVVRPPETNPLTEFPYDQFTLQIPIPTEIASGNPIKAYKYERSRELERVRIRQEYKYKTEFTGLIVNGALQSTRDSDDNYDISKLDTTKKEFILYRDDDYLVAVFNQDDREEYTETIGVSAGEDSVYCTTYFPYQDYPGNILDVTSTILTVDSEGYPQRWTRVSNITDFASETNPDYTAEDLANISAGKVYEFDSGNGWVYMGPAERESGSNINLTGTLVPELIYEPNYSDFLFTDYDLNANPIFRVDRGSFLVLSDLSDNPYKIRLEILRTDTPSFGRDTYNFVTYQDNDIYLVATVVDKEGNPIQNHLVNFTALNEGTPYDAGRIVPERTLTDMFGKAYVRYYPPHTMDDYTAKVWLYNKAYKEDWCQFLFGIDYEEATEEQQEQSLNATINPLPINLYNMGKATNPFTTEAPYYSLIVDANRVNLTGVLDQVYLFGIYDNDELQPWGSDTQESGRKVVWYYNDGSKNALVRLNPDNPYTDLEDGTIELHFNQAIPSSYPPSEYVDPYEYLVGYAIVFPLTIRFQASTLDIYGDTLESNIVSLNVELASVAKGVWTLPDPTNNVWDGSGISLCTYECINPSDDGIDSTCED